MGDVQTHAEIARNVVPLLGGVPEAPLFEVGNWLTDVSQFRDPFAHLSGKKTIFIRGLNQKLGVPRLFHLADVFLGLDEYLNDLCGVPPSGRTIGTRPGANPASDRPDDGMLARYFRAILVLITCNPSFLAPLKLQQGLDAFSKDEIKAVFDACYTQYFPHEHVDFPPFPPDHPQRGTREPSTVPAAGQPRLVHDYTEKQLQYLGDLLTRIERDWAHAPSADPALRRELVARFGHASHAIEDWFFHSNFVEAAWTIASPGQPAPHAVLPPAPPDDVESVGPPPSENALQRRFHRRLRSPKFLDDGDVLDPAGSDPVTLLFTGSYGSNDLFFSLIDALGHVIGEPPDDFNRKFPGLLVMHKVLFGTEQEQKDSLEQWQKGIKNGSWVTFAKLAGLVNKLEPFELAALEEICSIEKKLLNDYPTIGLGVLGLIQQMFVTGRGVVKASLEHGVEIDQDPQHAIADDRSDNGSPGENPGSHSLLCKDSVRKEPLREATLRIANFTATYVAKTMVDRTPARSPAQPEEFVDWLELLRYFITHPSQAAGGTGTEWWRGPLASIDPRPPEGHTIVLKPLSELPSSPDEPRLAGSEQPYYDTAVFAEGEFTKAVDQAMVIDSILTGLVTGGITGMIAGGVAAPDGAGTKVGGVALGLLTGAVVAGFASGAGAGLGLVVSRHAGVVVGSYTGIVGGTVAAGFAASAVAGGL